MKHNKKLYVKLIIIIVIISLLTCCKNVETNIVPTGKASYADIITDDMYEKVTNVYKVKKFDLPDDFNYMSYSVNEYICIYGYHDLKYKQFTFDMNGEFIEEKNLSGFEDVRSIIILTGMQSNGNYVIVSDKEIYLNAPNGDLIAKQEYTYEYTQYLHISASDEIYLTTGNKLYVFDNNLELTAQIESTDTLFVTFSNKDNDIIVQSNSFKERYFILKNNNLEFYENDYIINKEGIFVNSVERTELLNWANSDILYNQIRKYLIVNEDLIVCELKDFFDTLHKPVILERVPDDEIKEKVFINLAITGFDNVGIVNEAIAIFNRSNDTYRIVTTDYTKYNTALNYDGATAKFNQDLIEEKIPDLVMMQFAVYNKIETYTDKGIFADLTEMINNSEYELLKCVQNSYCRGDKVYNIPIFMNLQTIVTKPSVIGENESFTLDKMYSIAENMNDNQALFSKNIDILSTAVYDFIDYDNNTYNFEDDGFIRLLEFQKNISDYVNTEKGAINSFSYNYFLTSDNLYDSLANNELLFSHLPFDKLNGYLINKICYGDDDFTICGYPNSTGNASMLSTEYTFCITEQSKIKNGAWEFIQFLLSDTIQNSETLMSYGLPVTVSGIEKLLDYYAEHYLYLHQTSEINKNQYTGDVYIQVMNRREINTDDHPNKQTADYVVVLTDKDKQKLIDFFNSTEVKSYTDSTITDIVNEEFNEYYADVITVKEAANRIQNRLFIYLNE